MVSPVNTQTKYDLPLPKDFTLSHKSFNMSLMAPAFSAITLSFGGHAVFPSIEKHMEDPRKFPFAFNMAYVTLLIMYISTAVAGYSVFGNGTYSPILCNLPRDTTPVGYVASVTKLLIAIHVVIAYPILLTVAASGMEEGMLGLYKHLQPGQTKMGVIFKRTLFRTCLVATTCLVAIKLPYFGDFMSLIGALCLVMMVFVLPIVFYWKVKRVSTLVMLWGIFVIIIGEIC